MSWKSMRLGDVLRLKRGHDLPKNSRTSGDIPIVSSSGITGWHNVAKVAGPGVVTGRYGTLGEVHYIEGDYWPLNTALYVEDFKGNHPRFAAYLLMTLELGSQNAAGAVPGVNRNTLHQMPVSVPDVETQRQVAQVLFAYDDLIATNQRRIALLDEAARRMYREWFVHLRFPGHKAVEVVDGVPEGWARKTLGQIAPLKYGKALKATERKDGQVPVYGSSGVVGNHDRALVDGGAIVVGRKGNVGSLYFSPGPCFPIDTVFFIDPESSTFYLLQALSNLNFISSDAAVPGLNRNYAHSLPLLVPAGEVAAAFETLVAPLYSQAFLLGRQNKELAKARDALLPKLMSGELEVTGIPLPQPEAA